MTGLRRLVQHDCFPPAIPDMFATYEWECPECQASWKWMSAMEMPPNPMRSKRGKRVPRSEFYAGWWFCSGRPERWEEVR